ncbi:MAG: hypothetical protein HFF20_04760 [Oscillospiraceae bacterium]|nr:hypothetical protein [Oscillospiraceae bacterium]
MKKDYMAGLEGWARWMLPRREAEEVIADYRELAGDPELSQGLARPRDAVRPLADKKAYRAWLAAFAAMAACILALGVSPTMTGYLFWRLFFDGWTGTYPYGAFIVTAFGAVTALTWFCRRRRREAVSPPIPKGLIAVLALLSVWIGLVFLFYWAVIRDLDGFLNMLGTMTTFIGPGNIVPRSTYLVQCTLCYVPLPVSLLAVYWLVRARTHDRRWAAAYILSLTAILVSLETVAELTRMDVTATPYEISMRARLLQCAAVTVLGLLGTGVSLC